MCSQITCRSCGKPTWAGCGLHIEDALRGVPASERCTCREMASPPSPSPGETATPHKAGGNFLSRLLGGD